MLRALRLLLAIICLVTLQTLTAAAEQQCVRVSSDTGLCYAWIEIPTAPERPSKGDGSGGGGTSSGGERTCSYGGREIPCTSPFGTWSGVAQGWCRAMDPQPPLTDPAWQSHSDGAVYSCVRPNGSLVPDPGMTFSRWLPAPPTAVTQAEAEAAARRVLASIGLEAIDLGMQPRGDTVERMGFVGWHTWLWADSPSDKQWGPVTATASDSGIAVRLTAGATRVQWDMGDGATVSCGRGAAWSAARTQGGKNVASPDCGHVYERDGRYTVTATSTWSVDWSAAGFTGTLPLQLSRSADVVVGEVQAVTLR